jgi:hypothetical protein
VADPRKLFKPIRAWHGSARDFDAFNPRMLESGAGNTGIGPGFNFTTNKSEALEYRDWALQERQRRRQPVDNGGKLYEVLLQATPDEFIRVGAPGNSQSKLIRDLWDEQLGDRLKDLVNSPHGIHKSRIDELLVDGIKGARAPSREVLPPSLTPYSGWQYNVEDPQWIEILNKYAQGGLVQAYQAGGRVKPLFSKLADLLGEHADQRAEELANRTLRTGREHWSLGTDFRPMSEKDFEPYILPGTQHSVENIPAWRLTDLEASRAPHERPWELHTHPSNDISPSVQDVSFWSRFPGFSHGIIGPGDAENFKVRDLDAAMTQPGFGIWEAPSEFFSPRAMSQFELRARAGMQRYADDVSSILRPHNNMDLEPDDLMDELGPYLGLDMWAKSGGPRVRYTRQYPEPFHLEMNPAVDELTDFFSKKNRFAEGGPVPEPSPEEDGARLLEPPPFLRNPLQEGLRPQGPSGSAPLSSLLSLAKPEKPQVNPRELEALLAKLAAGPGVAAPQAQQPPAEASPLDDYLAKIRVPDPAAVNKDTGATSAYDFIPSTFTSVARAHFPDLKGLSDAELTALMKDERVAKNVALAFTQDNERTLARSGIPASDYTRFLAHWFGPAGAVDLLTGDEARKMEDWFEAYYPKKGAHWAKANALEGKTAAEVLKIARERMKPRGGGRG